MGILYLESKFISNEWYWLCEMGLFGLEYITGIILYMRPANERRYIATAYLIGLGHTQNDPWIITTNVVIVITAAVAAAVADMMMLCCMMTSSNFPCYRPFVREITGHRWIRLTKASDAKFSVFSLICTWTNGWVNNRDADDLRRHLAHYGVTVMGWWWWWRWWCRRWWWW